MRALDGLKERFDAEPAVGDIDLNERLFSISGNGRSEQLRVAWDAGRERPLARERRGVVRVPAGTSADPTSYVVRDAHSLYMETFAELGVVGLALLGGALLLLVVAERPRAQTAVRRYGTWRVLSPGPQLLHSTGTGRWSV